MPNDVINTVTVNGTAYGIGGGGHTIKNPAGTAMTQRSNLQFVDLTVSDDSTNDVTKVENIHVIQSESELENLPDGLYMLNDDEDTVIDGNLVGYDNINSDLNAENVQDAIDEVVETLDDKADKVSSAINGNLAGLDTNGNLTDSGWAGAKDITSISGNPISINGLKSNQLAKDPIITFEPIQAGSGAPSPDNIREISGYDKVEVLSANGSDPMVQGYVKATSISESLEQTVYKGSLDIRTGLLTVTHKILDLGDYDWVYHASTSADDTNRFSMYTIIPDILNNGGDGTIMPYIAACSCYALSTGDDNLSGGSSRSGYISQYGSIFVITDARYNDSTAFKTAVTGQKVVYQLVTPFTIQLTPYEISLLKNYAYVSTNGTSIALKYYNGELASLGDVSQLGETVNKLGDYVNSIENVIPHNNYYTIGKMVYIMYRENITFDGVNDAICIDNLPMPYGYVPGYVWLVNINSGYVTACASVYFNTDTNHPGRYVLKAMAFRDGQPITGLYTIPLIGLSYPMK